MNLQIFTDGGSLNNPGQAAIAYVVYSERKIIYSFSGRIGINSNNFAEYSALHEALLWIKKTQLGKVTKIDCFSDSNLMVNQLNGVFKVKNAVIREFVLKVRVLEQEIKAPITYKYIPREKNTVADSLIKGVLTPGS